MSKKPMTYNRRLAIAAMDVFVEDGENFATPDMVHKKMYGHKCPSEAVRKDIRRRLGAVKALLNREFGMAVFSINCDEAELPETILDARRLCVGRGGGSMARALGRVNGAATQMIYQAEKEGTVSRASGMVRHNLEDVLEACVQDSVTRAKALSILRRAERESEPKRLSGAAKKLIGETHLLGNN